MISKYHIRAFTGKLAFEYNGCIYHGCPACMNGNENVRHPYNGHTMAQCYALTVAKKVHLEKMGYTVVTMWEHDFHNSIQNDPDLQTFVKSVKKEGRLEPRDSFFGGRTNASKLHYKVKGEEQLKYVDFTSLYQTISVSLVNLS